MENHNYGYYAPGQAPAPKPRHNPSLVLGIISIATLWFTAGVSGFVCGIIGLVSASRNRYAYNTSAGFVLSLLSLIVSIIILTIVVSIIFVLITMPDSIGAYYILSLIEAVFGKFGIGSFGAV